MTPAAARRVIFSLFEVCKTAVVNVQGTRNAAPTMGSAIPPPSRRLRRHLGLVIMGSLLLLLRADALVLSRSSFAGSGIQPFAPGRTRATSATSTAAMALGRNSSRSRPAPGKQGRARRSGCGGTPGGADGRAGVRARARRQSYYGDGSLSRGGGGEPLGFFDVGDVVWGVGRQQGKRSAGASRGRGSSSGFGKPYQPTRTAGGTFTARGTAVVVKVFQRGGGKFLFFKNQLTRNPFH